MNNQDEVREIYEQWKKEPGNIDVLVDRLSDHFNNLLASKDARIKELEDDINLVIKILS